jgi:Fur family ferric uptake transcriptional regulator
MDLPSRLRARKWRMTSQRRAIAQAFAGESAHLTADEVFVAARRHLPEISVATVYNTLHELVSLGELKEVDGMGRLRRYDSNVHAAHHHLTCESCGKIVDVMPVGDLEATLPVGERRGFTDVRAEVIYRGRCEDCVGQRRRTHSHQ